MRWTERMGFVLRRAFFWLYSATLVVAIAKRSTLLTNLTFWFLIVHILYFELSIPLPGLSGSRGTSTYRTAIRALHGASFIGSWVVALLAFLLVAVYDTGFLARRSRQLGVSITTAYADTVWVHWVPPIVTTADLILHADVLAAVHGHDRPWDMANAAGTAWFVLSGPLLALVWILTGHSMVKTYGADANHWVSSSLAGCAIAACAAAFSLFVLRKTHASSSSLVLIPTSSSSSASSPSLNLASHSLLSDHHRHDPRHDPRHGHDALIV